jgi:hypothetical protein
MIIDRGETGPARARPYHHALDELTVFVTTGSAERREAIRPHIPALCRKLKKTTHYCKPRPGERPRDPDLGREVESLRRTAMDSRTIDEDSRRRIVEVCCEILNFKLSRFG